MQRSLAEEKRARLAAERTLKSSNLVCLVCGAPATGFNFAVITCMCCKAFFRRNALFGLRAYACRYSTETCAISVRTRRDCSFCRLKKCFGVGMNKDLILTEDVKRLKRERLHANRQLTLSAHRERQPADGNVLNDLSGLFSAYEKHCRAPIRAFEKREYELTCHQPVKSRIKFQHYSEVYQVHRAALCRFFQCLPEFQQLPVDEQKALLCHQLRFLMRVNSIETMDDSVPLWGPIRFLLEIMYGKALIEAIDTRLHQVRFHLNDSPCTQLLLIVLLFSTSVNYTGHLHTLVIYRIQEKYTDIFWRYLTHRYGELAAYQKFAFIMHQCLYLQTLHHLLERRREEIQCQSSIFDAVDRF